MQVICVYLYSQCLKFYYKIVHVLLFLLEGLYFPFGIYSLGLVTESCLDFLYKLIPILGFYFPIQLIKLFLDINAYYALSKVGKNCSDLVVYFYNSVTLEKQSYFSLPVLEFYSIPIELSWVRDYVLRQFCLSIELFYQYC